MDEETLEKTKELTKVNPVAEPEPETPKESEFDEQPEKIDEIDKLAQTMEFKPEPPKKQEQTQEEYDKTKHNRLMMEFDAHDLDEETPKTLKESKKNIMLLILLAIGIIVVMVLLGIFLSGDKNKTYDYEYYTDQAIIEVYNNQNNEKLTEVLKNIKDNKKAIEYLQKYTKEQTTSWVNGLVKQDFSSKVEFQQNYTKTKQQIEILHNTKEDKVLPLTNEDYDNITKRLRTIESDGNKFYDGIDLYNNKDYNEAYHTIKDTYTESEFYTKSIKVADQIIESFFEDLQKELDNIQIINEEDNQIALKLLNDYITKYNYLKLDKNDKYKEIMKRYQG